jgi:aspartate racemase
MHTIGIIGGLGPESTVDYYQRLIAEYKLRTDGIHYPSINIVSIDMVELLLYVEHREYDKLVKMLDQAIDRLIAAGSTVIAISSNTPHIVFNQLKKHDGINIISIVEATCGRIQQKGYRKTLLTGTQFTMRENFYGKQAERYGISIVLPSENDIMEFHRVIFPELEDGIIVPAKKQNYKNLVAAYIAKEHIDSVILGCTELPLMIQEGDLSVPILNTSQIHVEKIMAAALL